MIPNPLTPTRITPAKQGFSAVGTMTRQAGVTHRYTPRTGRGVFGSKSPCMLISVFPGAELTADSKSAIIIKTDKEMNELLMMF